MTKSNFHLVTYASWIITVQILSTYKSVAIKLTKFVLFEVGLLDIWPKKFFCFLKLNYLTPSQMEISKFATLL